MYLTRSTPACRALRTIFRLVLLAGLLLGAAPAANATVYEISPPTTIGSILPTLQAGDTLILHAGDYARTYTGAWLGGNATGGYITIKGADGEPRPRIIYNGIDKNVFDFNSAQYIRLQNIEITGGSDAFKINGTCHHIELINLYMHHMGSGGVNCSNATNIYNLTVRDCEIAYTSYGSYTPGEGFYLGKHGVYSQPQVHDSLIERCYVHHIGGSQGDGLELKHGCHRVVVQDCVISAANGYPGITSWSTYKNDPAYNNVLRRNFIYGSTDAGIHVTGEIDIENNIIVNSIHRGIHCRARDYDSQMKYTRIVNNTIYNAGDAAIDLLNWNTGTGLVLANNVIYQDDPAAAAIHTIDGLAAAAVANNLYYGTTDTTGVGLVLGPTPAEVFLNASATLGEMDLYPLPGGPLIDAGDAANAPALDFIPVARPQGAALDIGAYEAARPYNPGWALAAGFKPVGLQGDFDLDGHVDVSDLLTFAASWALSEGDPGFDPAADFDGDGTVDVSDLLTLAGNWAI